MTNSPFHQYAPTYWSYGLPVIPLDPYKKKPPFWLTGWTLYASEMPSEETQQEWLGRCPPGSGLGLPLGEQSGVVIIDVDAEERAVIEAIESVLPPTPWTRVGRKGYAAAYKYNGEKTRRLEIGTTRVVELLSTGTQVVLPPSIHPDTHLPYKSNCDLFKVLDRLQELPHDFLIQLEQALSPFGVKVGASAERVKLTKWVPAGVRDNSMIRMAGFLAYAVLRGELTLQQAIVNLYTWHETQTENVVGDPIDIRKGVERLIEYIKHDIEEEGKTLPANWDDGLDDEYKEALKITVSEEFVQVNIPTLSEEFLKDISEMDGSKISSYGLFLSYAKRIALSTKNKPDEVLYIEQFLNTVKRMIPEISIATARRVLKEAMRGGGADFHNHQAVATDFIRTEETLGELASYQSKLHQWNGAYFDVVKDHVVMSKIAYKYGGTTACKKETDIKSIFRLVKTHKEREMDDEEFIGLCMANGVLLPSGELVPHDQKYNMRYMLEYNYRPELADSCSRWLNFLEGRFEGDPDKDQKIECVRDVLCATFTKQLWKFQKCVLLYGAPNSGKSQILSVVSRMLPQHMISYVPPARWSDKFEKTMMAGRVLNVAGELSNKDFIDGETFKLVIEGAQTNGQLKGEQLFQFRTTCSQWMGSNFLPRTSDTSAGFTRRWLPIHFNNPVKEVIVNYADLLVSEEREAILAWSMLSLEKVCKGEITIPSSSKAWEERMAQANNDVRAWIMNNEDVELGEEYSVSVKEAYQHYWKTVVNLNERKPAGFTDFCERIEGFYNLGIVPVYKNPRGDHGTRIIDRLKGIRINKKGGV